MEKIIFKKIFPEIILTLLVGVIVFVSSFLEPDSQGFFCNDRSLDRQLKQSTVSKYFLCLFYFVIPNTVIWYDYYICSYKSMITTCNQTIYFWLGSGLAHITVNIGKYCTGRLRPNFFQACKPNIKCLSKDQFIDEYICTNSDVSVAIESKKSFPSAHACLAFYSAIYTIGLVHKRKNNALLVILQFILFLSAWYTGLTRISDNMHHSTDVIAGSMIGVLFATVMMYNLKFFDESISSIST
ncbi:putative phosphatidate phosphatase [Daktulosphaira vitifoliae]|uniref:putative phosphatidate phosphatase n=1 Tax=Daktulosphaira vitifoliae TaxID=58002 RepID=UPI0021A9D7B5|nr:putative phosphatidate phosphatase [Daktulosphaira vitifoliae]